MPTQRHVPVQPAGARNINTGVAMIERDGQVAYVASGVPLCIHAADDPVGRRVAAAQMLALLLAPGSTNSGPPGRPSRHALAAAEEQRESSRDPGRGDRKRGPRGPHRFTATGARA